MSRSTNNFQAFASQNDISTPEIRSNDMARPGMRVRNGHVSRITADVVGVDSKLRMGTRPNFSMAGFLVESFQDTVPFFLSAGAIGASIYAYLGMGGIILGLRYVLRFLKSDEGWLCNFQRYITRASLRGYRDVVTALASPVMRESGIFKDEGS